MRATMAVLLCAALAGALTFSANPDPESEMVLVPAGEFVMGGDGRFSTNQKTVYLKAFRIDKYEVSNREYKRFIDQTKRNPPDHWLEGNYLPGMDGHPVYGVSWEDARAYAQWSGKRLPSVAEWEKAARGTDGRLYPWGNQPDPKKCNAYESKPRNGTYGPESLDPVKSHPEGASPYDAYNMTGNVWEWTATETRDGGHILCGGSCGKYIFDIPVTRCASAGGAEDDVIYLFIGFRCAKDVAE